MSNNVGRRIVDLFRSRCSKKFAMQAVMDGSLRVWLERSADGYEILESPLGKSGKGMDSMPPASVARFKGKDVANALRKCAVENNTLVGALLPGHIAPNEGLPLTVLAEARLEGKKSARLFIGAGFEFSMDRLVVDPLYIALQEAGCGIRIVPVSGEKLLAALEIEADLWDAAFDEQPGAISLLLPFVSGARELREALSIEEATPVSVQAPTLNPRL